MLSKFVSNSLKPISLHKYFPNFNKEDKKNKIIML